MILSGIGPANFRLVAQCLNQPRAPSCIQQPTFQNRFHVHILKGEYWINEKLCVCVCVCVCVFARIIFCGGDDDSKNIFTLQLKVIKPLVLLINVRPVDRYLSILIYNIHTVASLYIYSKLYVTLRSTKTHNVQIHNYNSWIYMYNCAVQSS
jgi:hypothetical protein